MHRQASTDITHSDKVNNKLAKNEEKEKKKQFVEALIFMYLKQNEAQSARAESTNKGVN